METIIETDIVSRENEARQTALKSDYAALGEKLARRGIAIDAVLAKVQAFGVAIPSWGVGTGGTRFARFPGGGEPRDIFDKIEDCAVVQQLTRATPTVSLHIPWDKAEPKRLKQAAARFGLGFDAMNSNTFSDAADQKLSYKFGSLSHADAAVRRQAVEHNLECIEIGSTLGSKALTVWIGDGSNFPGQVNFARAFSRYLEAMADIYAALPDDWRLFSEHKMYEPAFYSTVVQDWGTNYIIAKELGPKAFCLVDLPVFLCVKCVKCIGGRGWGWVSPTRKSFRFVSFRSCVSACAWSGRLVKFDLKSSRPLFPIFSLLGRRPFWAPSFSFLPCVNDSQGVYNV